MRNATFRLLALVVAVFLIGGAAPVQAQGAFAHGAVVALQGTPHLWFADERGVLHWGGDTRALVGKHIDWNDRVEVSLDQLHTLPVGDPWLTAGLLKDGDPIYLVKWESNWEQPQLLHIQSIKDVELFGINGSNYGNFVIDRPAWESRYGISAAGLQRGTLPAATTIPGAVTSLPPPPPSDRNALIAFYNATGGANWDRKQNWLTDAPLKLWYGVEIDEDGRVTRLDLGLYANNFDNNLTGQLPAELGSLTNLEYLHLGNNNLTGPIPAELGNLTKLRWLRLEDNNLTGPLPATLGSLTKLTWLDLSENSLTGPLPQSLTELTELYYLDFSDTELCAPANDAFRVWIEGINSVRGKWGCPAS